MLSESPTVIASADILGDGSRQLVVGQRWADMVEGYSGGFRISVYRITPADGFLLVLNEAAEDSSNIDAYGKGLWATTKSSLHVTANTGSTPRGIDGTRRWRADRFTTEAKIRFRWNGDRFTEDLTDKEKAQIKQSQARFEAESLRVGKANFAAAERMRSAAVKKQVDAVIARVPALVRDCVALTKHYGELQSRRKKLEAQGNLQAIQTLVPALRAAEEKYRTLAKKLRSDYQALLDASVADEVLQAARRSITGTCSVSLPAR